MNMRWRDTARFEYAFDLVAHRSRPADERLVDRAWRNERVEETGHLCAVHPSVEKLHRLDVAREHVIKREARQVAVFEVLERLVEDDRTERAVAVDQRKARLRLASERR